MKLEIVPITKEEACDFVDEHHRHSVSPQGWKFGCACSDGEKIVGVVIVGRPVARHQDDGWTLEVIRNCTDGTPNACSKLYGAAWRAARALGYRRVITYTLKTAGGASLKASGFTVVHEVRNQSWHRENRPRIDKHDLAQRLLWEVGGPN